MTLRSSNHLRQLLAIGLVTLLAVACASSPTATQAGTEAAEGTGSGSADQPNGTSAPTGSASEADTEADTAIQADTAGEERLQEISAELDGLDREARRQRLTELAQEEGQLVEFYGSTNIEDITPVLDAFEEATGIAVSYYRAGGQTVLNRLLEEAAAGFVGADVVELTASEMPVLEAEGFLIPLDTPIREDILEAGRFDTWLATYINTYIAAWNTDHVSEEERPTTWEEVLQFDGRLSMDVRDFEWFATLVEGYFMEERGMTEDEAVELFKEAGRNTIFVSGHSIGSQMLVAGEFDVNATMYHHHTDRFPEDAPYEWEPPIEPIVIAPSGIGILRSTSRPATALLFLEFMLTDGQPLLAESGRTVASTVVEGGLPTGYETIAVDVATVNEEREKWEALFQEVAQQSGREPIQ